MNPQASMTEAEWAALGLQVVATGAAAAASIAAWRSVVGISREREAEALRREADERWRANEHLKTIQALIVEWSQAYSRDRGSAFEVLMELRAEVHVMTAQEGPLPQCVALANREHSTIMADEVNGLAEVAWNEVEAARVHVFEGHTVDPSPGG
jgi:hypothetical protein